MDPTAIAIAATKLLSDFSKAFPASAKHVETLKGQIDLLTLSNTTLERERDGLKLKVADQARELTDLREQLTAYHVETSEIIEGDVVFRVTSSGREGPFCPSDRSVRLVPCPTIDFRWMCPKCHTPFR
jgi:hypothetical protein